ncbi:MAG: ATP-binding protein [Lachnospiraceae bacterium]|nr:ATP-binding protein [Lachnospiraceae bacterium]
MGKYLNPGYGRFKTIRNGIYVDKSGLIGFLNDLIDKPKPLVCFSRPRRFGKSFAASMLCAYYDRSCDSRFLFEDLKVSGSDSFEKYLNKYNVISFDVTGFITDSEESGTKVLKRLQSALMKELKEAFPDCVDSESHNLSDVLFDIVSKGNEKFVFVIDEWDALFREYKDDHKLQKDYILFLRTLFKNQDTTEATIAAAYITGILPIKKYGSESAVSDFQEYTMTDPGILEEYVGFTENEVQMLCARYHVDFNEMSAWYDGYSFCSNHHVYNPNSVMNALQAGKMKNFWIKSESFENLKDYISRDYDGLKHTILLMLGGQHAEIDINTFKNDITSFESKDDVLTLLIHLGYLAYDENKKAAYIPNREVSEVFQASVKGGKWTRVDQAIRQAETLLNATIHLDGDAVSHSLELIHEECASALTYNDENSLACAIYIAYYTARNYYMLIRELPAGKGFADYAFLPRKDTDKPAMIIELKYDKDADTAIRQIHENRYDGALKDYSGNLLLVGINYDRNAKGSSAKKHSCVIERA